MTANEVRDRVGRSSSGGVPTALVVLVLLSGFCGISYEILYARLLGNLLGDPFVVNASVLLTFLLGIAFGTLFAHRLARWLWLIEASIGGYALLFVLSQRTLERWVPGAPAGTTAAALGSAAVAVLLLVAPAFLIGCSVPLFAGLVARARGDGTFALAYGAYNLGAAAVALAMEFVLLRAVGLRAAGLTLAAMNGLVAIGVLTVSGRAGWRPPPEAIDARDREPPFSRRLLSALALASVASAVFQLAMIKLAEFLFGPFNETFALVLATTFVGLTVGSWLVARTRLSFAGALALAAAGVAWVLAIVPTAVEIYATVRGWSAGSYPRVVGLKLFTVAALMLPAASGFGATVPAILRARRREIARDSGRLLFVASLANALGFFLMASVLHRHLEYGVILLAVAVAGLLAIGLAGRSSRPARSSGLVASVIAVTAMLGVWDESLLYLGHTNFNSRGSLQARLAEQIETDRFRGHRDVFAIVRRDGDPYFFINGYISIALDSPAETLVGALSAALAPRRDRALVLGVGSGKTAGTVGLLFDQVDAVEINRVVLDNLHRMAEYNFDLPEMSNVDLVHGDGIRFVRTAEGRYPLILNTVTTPLYFSSSKLYTLDFFELIRKRLAPDGVYVTWIDSRIGDRGVEIVLETLQRAFNECWLSYMNAEYFLLTCSPGEIAPRAWEEVPRFEAYLRKEHQLTSRLIPLHVLSTDALALRSSDPAPINTLDHPVLEFEMARLAGGSFEQFGQRLVEAIDLTSVRRELASAIDWRPAEFAVVKDLRLRRRATLTGQLHRRVEALFESPDDYRAAALELGDEVGTGEAYFRIGLRLLARDEPAAAASAFERALALGAPVEDMNYHQGRALAELGERNAALEALDRQWSLDSDARAAVLGARLAVELDRPHAAEAWLQRAVAVGADRAAVASVEGAAFEAGGRVADARFAYRRALAVDPAHEEALAALARIDSTDERE